MCPSAQPTLAGAVLVGVVDHASGEPELAYLEEPIPVTEELLALTSPVRPTEVFRFAAPCQQGVCAHWSGSDCRLVERIVDLLPATALTLPRCAIRGECRWFAQSGGAACRRCPQVVTQNEQPSDEMREAATPR
ncbi:MAG: hypothetical protein IT379_24205 [Deltaproteobacteria bacterium]|nr:hypothetical protein [Deltaproteobacteria bacterium]